MYTIKTIEMQDIDGSRGIECVTCVIEDDGMAEIAEQLFERGLNGTEKMAKVWLTDQNGDDYEVEVAVSDYKELIEALKSEEC